MVQHATETSVPEHTREEFAEVQPLLESLRRGDNEAARELTERFLDWVFQAARDVSYKLGSHVEEVELYGPGVEGLLEALKRYDPDRGAGLRTFCKPRIRGAMLDEVRRVDPVPRSERLRVRRIQRAQEDLTQSLARPPAEHELAAHLGVVLGSPKLVTGAQLTRGVRAFSDLVSPSQESSGADELGTEVEDAALEGLFSSDAFDALLRDTSPKERMILDLYYRGDLSMREIGERLQLCESRVSQIHKNVLARLRSRLSGRPT